MKYYQFGDYEHLKVATVRFSTPVTGLAAFFGSLTPQAAFKKCEAHFLKEAKTAAFRLSAAADRLGRRK